MARIAVVREFLVLAVLLGTLRPGWAEENRRDAEIELTPDVIRAIESQIGSSGAAAAPDIYDRLAFGKGNFVRIDGKSRKSAVLTLAGQSQYLLRLWDLPAFDTRMLAPGREYHFGGVLSKIERTSQGTVEVSITYSNLSEVPGRFYSRQAQEFVERTQQLKQRNQQIAGQASQTVPALKQESAPAEPSRASPRTAGVPNSKPPAEASSSSPPASPTPPSSSKPAPKSEETKSPSEDNEGDKEREEPAPRNRPVLKRRVESDRTPAEAEPSKGTTTAGGQLPSGSQSPADDDVVIYRRKDGTKQSSSGARSAPPPESSDRPVLRRKPADSDAERPAEGMKLIPEGYLTLGSDDPSDNDRPLHRVLVKSFYLDTHEVTNQDYKQFCDATGRQPPPYWKDKTYPKELERHPVVQVSWLDALAYARWAGKRLPTEAEWERAAKGPNNYRYAYGNSYDAQKANTETGKTSAVGSYPANEFGLFDMTGNVCEWTSSLYLPYPYRESDGREDSQTGGARVLRGAGYSSNEKDARCLVRQKELPDHGSPLLGFRCARDAG